VLPPENGASGEAGRVLFHALTEPQRRLGHAVTAPCVDTLALQCQRVLARSASQMCLAP